MFRFVRNLGETDPAMREHSFWAFFDLGLEDNPVALQPTLGPQCLAGYHGGGEAQFESLELCRVIPSPIEKKMSERVAKGTETVEDRLLEAGILGKFGFSMEGIEVQSTQTVQEVLQHELFLSNRRVSPDWGWSVPQ